MQLQNVSLARGVRVLYRNVTLSTSPREIVGLVGPNGSGKSTLFAAILGQIGTEAGDISAPEAERISHVAQRIEETDAKAMDFVLEGALPSYSGKEGTC